MPQQLFNCQALKKLSMPDNDLSSLPTTIASLVNLKELDISKNGKKKKKKKKKVNPAGIKLEEMILISKPLISVIDILERKKNLNVPLA